MLKFKNKYRAEPLRLKEWDYSFPSYYFITFCTNNREKTLGTVSDDKFLSNEYSSIVEEEIINTENKRANVKIDCYQIMPNHVHLLILLDNDFPLDKTNNISIIISQIKSISSKRIQKAGFVNFKWQKTFYDRIVRNENELAKIRNYIIQNPLRWCLDKYYKSS